MTIETAGNDDAELLLLALGCLLTGNRGVKRHIKALLRN